MKSGRSLEKLVEQLEKILADQGNIFIESPKKLLDKENGEYREHDVVLTIKEHHHQVMIAIECRDRSRPITVNQVEGFWAKCQHTGINQGIIVSSNGFSKTARSKAAKLGIRCLALEEVSSFNWLLPKGITSFQRQIKNTNWTMITENIIEEIPSNFSLVDDHGNLLTAEILNANVQNYFQQQESSLEELQKELGTHELKIIFPGEGVFILNDTNGKLMPVKSAVAHVEYEVKAEHIPFELYKYVDKSLEVKIVEAAVTKVKFGDAEVGKIFIGYKDGEGIKVKYVPNRDNM